MEGQNTFNNKRNPENKSSARDITVPGFTLYYRAIVTKSAQYWHTIRHVDQRDKIEDPEINPCSYRYLIINRNLPFNMLINKWCWEKMNFHM
jgi:hypothetical protein